jgi:hypothetical protein
LTDVDASTQTPRPLLNREVTEKLVQSLKNGGRLQSQDGSFGQQQSSADQTEAILAGLVADGANGMVKPETFGSEQTVKLNFGNRRKQAANGTEKAQAAAVPANAVEEINLASIAKKETNGSNGTQNGLLRSTPAGVGFINNEDDLDGGYEDEDEEMEFPSDEQLENAGRIDPDSLLSEADRQKPLVIRKSIISFPPNLHTTSATVSMRIFRIFLTSQPPPKAMANISFSLIRSRSLQTQHQAPTRLQRLQLRPRRASRRRR